jgi:hypothetical protein
MIKARMRNGASWNDVCILNLSRRGMGIQAANPPARGTYVEICRGRQSVVARVMWTKGHRAGLQSQDAIWVEALINEALAANDQAPRAESAPRPERRRAPRTPAQQHERSRHFGRAAEFACFALLAGAAATVAFGAVEQALARPLSTIRAALGPE